ALLYYVMEYLEGSALSDELKDGAPLAVARTLHICAQVASALGAVHEKGIVHRDLKPANIFLTTRARHVDFLKLFDFGIAKLRSQAVAEMTQAGTIMGTPASMAPEQIRGELIDHRVA